MTILTGYLTNFGFIIFYENLELISEITGFHIATKNDVHHTKYTMFPTHSLHRYGGLLLSFGYQILIKSEYNSDNSINNCEGGLLSSKYQNLIKSEYNSDNSICIKDCYNDESS